MLAKSKSAWIGSPLGCGRSLGQLCKFRSAQWLAENSQGPGSALQRAALAGLAAWSLENARNKWTAAQAVAERGPRWPNVPEYRFRPLSLCRARCHAIPGRLRRCRPRRPRPLPAPLSCPLPAPHLPAHPSASATWARACQGLSAIRRQGCQGTPWPSCGRAARALRCGLRCAIVCCGVRCARCDLCDARVTHTDRRLVICACDLQTAHRDHQ